MENTTQTSDGGGANTQTDDQSQKRARSQIDFPYADIKSAEELVEALYSRGGGSAEPSQLAGWLDMSSQGGTFRSRVSAARLYGFVETTRGAISITDLGRQVVDEASAPAARVTGFLNVPLFREMFEKNNGYALPPAAAIERQMVEFGVPMKQKGRARQVFQKSANTADFIDQSSGRFIKPSVNHQHPTDDPPPADNDGADNDGGGGGGGDGGYHPFIQGLLNELPASDEFKDWKVEDQAEWLRTAAGIFKLMSKRSGRIDINVENASPDRSAGASRDTEGTSTPSVLD